jgi:imidazolonepropionase-like amidohydrolase
MRTTILLCLLPFLLTAQPPAPAPPQQGPILILGATAHLGNGQVLPNSAIAFDKGKITLVADAATIRLDRKQFAKIFDASGKHVYPGFIAPDARLGLVEIDAVRATQDFAEVGAVNPNARSIIAYNTDSEVIPTVRANGVLLAQVVPTGGLVSGLSSVVQLDAWNWEDAAYRTDDGVHLNWPQPRRPGARSFRRGPQQEGGEQEDGYEKSVQELHRYFSEAKAYTEKKSPDPVNLRFEAMRGLFSGQKNLYIHVSQARLIQEAVLFAEQHSLKPVVVGGNDAWMITGFLKTHNVPVILSKSHRLPGREDEDPDQPYKTAAALHAAGILFCICEDGGWRQRNLPFQAGQAVGYGLPAEAAVQCITQNAARILGIDAITGTLETGKDANLFISEGDALDMRTNQVTAAFIQGREINLDNKQKELYRRYEEKYRK